MRADKFWGNASHLLQALSRMSEGIGDVLGFDHLSAAIVGILKMKPCHHESLAYYYWSVQDELRRRPPWGQIPCIFNVGWTDGSDTVDVYVDGCVDVDSDAGRWVASDRRTAGNPTLSPPNSLPTGSDRDNNIVICEL